MIIPAKHLKKNAPGHRNYGKHVPEACIVNGKPYPSTWAGFQAHGLTEKIWASRCTYWRTRKLKLTGEAVFSHPETPVVLHCKLISLAEYKALVKAK